MTKRKYVPVPLGLAGQHLVDSITSWAPDGNRLEFRPDELAILRLAAEAADTLDRLNRLGVDAPLFVENAKGDQVPSPLLLETRSWNRALAGHLKQLHLTDDAQSSDWDTMTASQRARRASTIRWSS
jgi:hypothetical protein